MRTLVPNEMIKNPAVSIISAPNTAGPLSVSSNLTLAGSSPRIIAAMSTSPSLTRLMFQTNDPTSSSFLGIIPGASGTDAAFSVYARPDSVNTHYGTLWATDSPPRIIIGSGRRGTGVAAPVELWTSDTARWIIGADGHFTAGADNTYDIGAVGASRPRSIYVGGAFVGGGAVPSGGAAGQLLVKNSNSNYDLTWQTPAPSTPTGPAGGALAGTYPNPTLAASAVNSAAIAWPLLAPIGSPGAPSYSFSGFPGNGMRYQSATPGDGIVLESRTARMVVAGRTDTSIVGNAWNNASNWTSWDTANGSTTFIATTGQFYWYTAPATTGNIVWTNRMLLDGNGLLTVYGAVTVNGGINMNEGGANNGLIFMSGGNMLARTNGTFYWQNMAGVTGATLTAAGGLSVATLGVSGTLNVTGGGGVGGRFIFSGANTVAIGTGTTSAGGLEIQPSGGGASMISFHRPGSFAAYFGLDTDNVWKVGGWSMGAVSYPLILGNFTNTAAVTAATVTSSGWVYANGNHFWFSSSAWMRYGTSGTRIDTSTGFEAPGLWSNNDAFYFGTSGSYYWLRTQTNYVRSVAMHIMSDGVFAFNANSAINLSSDNTNIASSHRFLAPNFSVGSGGSYQMVDTNVRIARPAGTNIMYIYAYDAQWAFIRTPDATNVGYVDNGGFHSISKLKHKTNIVPIRDGLKLVCDQRVTPISYAVKGYQTPDTPSLGFSAEDMARVVPNAVGHDEEGPASINYGSLVAVLWDAVRTLNTRIEELEKAS